jgi:poly(3-hydroxyalkanoate) depolymerase
LPKLALLATRLLDELGYDQADALGISWGGALAQEFAHRHPDRCRRLVLVSTSAGAVAVPGKPSVLARMVTPRRYLDPSYMEEIAPELYGGEVERNPELARQFAAAMSSGGGKGYYYQLTAIAGWTSIRWLSKLRQPTLIIAGTEDPIVPVANAKLMARLIPDSRLHVVKDGHLALLTSAKELAPVVERFLLAEERDGGRDGGHDRG